MPDTLPGKLELISKTWRIRCRHCGLSQLVAVRADQIQEEVVTELRSRGWERHAKGWKCPDCAAQHTANPFGK